MYKFVCVLTQPINIDPTDLPISQFGKAISVEDFGEHLMSGVPHDNYVASAA
jgi:hypothetical protein